MALPINHLVRTLQRCCGKFEILSHTSSESTAFAAIALQKATGESYSVSTLGKTWSSTSAFLASRLNGLTRTDAGDPIMETPDKEATQ